MSQKGNRGDKGDKEEGGDKKEGGDKEENEEGGDKGDKETRGNFCSPLSLLKAAARAAYHPLWIKETRKTNFYPFSLFPVFLESFRHDIFSNITYSSFHVFEPHLL
jgi:hypothetical protein